jgi:hypothetical protein
MTLNAVKEYEGVKLTGNSAYQRPFHTFFSVDHTFHNFFIVEWLRGHSRIC